MKLSWKLKLEVGRAFSATEDAEQPANLDILYPPFAEREVGVEGTHIPQFLRTPRCNALGRLNGMRVQRGRERKTTKCRRRDEDVGSVWKRGGLQKECSVFKAVVVSGRVNMAVVVG